MGEGKPRERLKERERMKERVVKRDFCKMRFGFLKLKFIVFLFFEKCFYFKVLSHIFDFNLFQFVK